MKKQMNVAYEIEFDEAGRTRRKIFIAFNELAALWLFYKGHPDTKFLSMSKVQRLVEAPPIEAEQR